MSDSLVGSGGTPAGVSVALKVAGWDEVPGSLALWKKNGCTPLAWQDVLLVLAHSPAATQSEADKPGHKTTEFRQIALVVLTSLSAGVAALTGALPSLPEAQRGPVGVGLLVVGAMLSAAYGMIRTSQKAAANDDVETPASKPEAAKPAA